MVHSQISSEEGMDGFISYYATLPLRESPYPDFKGVVQISKEEAQKRNHYEFQYDSLFRPKIVSFKLGNHLIEPNHTANYFFTTPQQQFAYEGTKEIRTFFDRFGNQITQRKAFKEIYVKDSMGRYTQLYFEDEERNRIENSWGIFEYRWKTNIDGSVVEVRVDQEGNPVSLRPGFEFYAIRLTYYQNGLLALMQNIDETGNLIENNSGVAQDKLHFDREGKWYGWTVLDAQDQLKRGNGPNVAKGINTTNRYGYERSIRYEDIDGSALINSHGFWGSIRYYDRHGNYNYTQFLDKDGNPGINKNTGYSIAKYTWGENGRIRIRIDFLGVDNEPVLHKTRGYASVKQEYDTNDNLIKTSFFGLKGELVNRTDNHAAYILYHYDKNKKLVGIKFYQKDGTELK